MSSASKAPTPRSKKALRQIYIAIGNPLASWAAFGGGCLIASSLLSPYVEPMPLVPRVCVYVGIAAALGLAEHLFVKPWNGSRMLKAIAKIHGPRTSEHIYNMFANDRGDRVRVNIPEIAKSYGERP